MIKKLTVDRKEEDTAVLLDEDGKEYNAVLPYGEGDILECEVDGEGEITVIRALEDETEKRKTQNALRLNALFGRKRDKK